jgi:DNA-binding winged helix-turn-helix (wHTH) protein
MPEPRPRRWRFGDFRLDPETGQLTRGAETVPLQERAVQVLEALLAARGRLVSREALRDAIWGEETWGDLDHSLNNAVARLRRALGDDAADPRYVETLPRRGYRLVSQVSEEGPASPAAARWPAWLAGAAALVAALLLALSLVHAPDLVPGPVPEPPGGELAAARRLARDRSPASLLAARSRLRAIVTRAPSSSAAWAELAGVEHFLAAAGVEAPSDAYDTTRRLAHRALALDPDQGWARSWSGWSPADSTPSGSRDCAGSVSTSSATASATAT